MTKLTTERLKEIANLKITEFSDGTDTANGAYQSVGSSEIVLMARQLMAYEQAAKNPIGYTDDEELRDLSRVGTAYIVNGEDKNIDVNDGRWFPVYRAPVLPNQPEPVAWRYDDGVAKGMAVTVYKCVADSWIARGYKATPLFESAPAQLALEG